MKSPRERERERERESYKSFNIDVKKFLIELRTDIIKKTINEFIYDMGWSNEKYYSKIVNGFKINGDIKYSNPTINYIFGGIAHALSQFDDWKTKEVEIENLIKKYFYVWKINL
ncbi:MAG: hypothetical protein RSC02_00805 [Malacoplasma sp.]